jgi:ABC-type glycerol-3-phosphate transport system substrate-binding protein
MPAEPPERQRKGRLRAGAKAAAGWLRGRWGWSGFGVGVLAGAVAAVMVAMLVPALVPGTDLEPGPLVILSGKDDSDGGQRHKLIDQWNALHPGNPARIEELPGQADAQHSEMLARAQSGSHPVDIYNLDVTWIAEFADAGYLRPLRESGATTGFLSSPMATCRYSGRLWALPFNSDAGLLYRRTDLIKEPPTSLGAMSDDIDRVFRQAGGNPPVKAGYAGQFDDYEGLTVNALEAIWAAGGDVVDTDGHVVIDSPETREGLGWLATGLREGKPQVILRDSASYDEEESTDAFRDGKVVFVRNWPVAYRKLAEAGQRSTGNGPLQFDVSKLPGPSVLGGQDLAIASGTQRPRTAQALIEFLTSERSQQILFERGGFAATREIVYRDAEVVKHYPYAPVLLDAIRAARPRPVTRHYPRFTEEFREIVLSALHDGGNLPPDAQGRLTDALRGY